MYVQSFVTNYKFDPLKIKYYKRVIILKGRGETSIKEHKEVTIPSGIKAI